MNPVRFLGDALQTAGKAIGFLWRQQGAERSQLIADMQAICSRCDDAYTAVLAALRPVKDSFQDRDALARSLLAFSADGGTRSAFKPEHLCGEVDQILQRLTSNVDWLKYSVDIRGIARLRGVISSMGSYDGQLWDYYDDHTRAMDDLATELKSEASEEDLQERQAYAQHVVTQFEADLREALKKIREAKEDVRKLM